MQNHTAADRFDRAGEIGAGIDKDGDQARVIISITVKQKQARLGRDGDLDLIGQAQPATAFKVLLGQKNLDMALKLARSASVKRVNIGTFLPMIASQEQARALIAVDRGGGV